MVTDMETIERTARQLAADKMGLINDPTGSNLPDDLWQQCIPDAKHTLGLEQVMDAYDIKTMIEEDVRCDIHGDLYGHERVAEIIAERFDALMKQINILQKENARMKQEMKDYDEDLEEAFRLKEW